MLHSVKEVAGPARNLAGPARLQQAARRVRSGCAMADQCRAHLGERLRQIAAAGSCPSGGQRYVLAQNAGSHACPLWLPLCKADARAGELLFSGNRQPVEFSERDAIELAPQMGAFMCEVEFRRAGGAKHG